MVFTNGWDNKMSKLKLIILLGVLLNISITYAGHINIDGISTISGTTLNEIEVIQIKSKDGTVLYEANKNGNNTLASVLVEAVKNGIDLRNAYLPKINLSHQSIENSILEYTNLRQANLSESNFNNSNLSGSDLTLVKAKRAVMTNSNMLAIRAVKANLAYVDFTGSDLSDSVLANGNMKYTIFSGTNLVNVDFRSSDLTGAKFSNSNLERTDFRGANLLGVEFSTKQISEAILDKADWFCRKSLKCMKK
ncbi:hypothetical protein BPLS_P4822 [Bathymodiolus platifrons methanotrophic gill symbiont]|nr:hypothetical protein BMR11_11525 [Methylococcaceae bacterium CS5]TXL02736.1 hypothetical protein BMR09_16285 [Methylococcaceae bacterium CS3]TXL04395.1 hypothetical protein BMR07_12595 [Methylococcaceae bacterium CS1]TXL09661.1 hypothetical protein BMR08_12865 [Methylococcaceae bacterium CS2]TXL19105.1 hypothetical protein BMR06_11520 [Methylococcaceae bacterium HT5]GFO76807.1 hypothetical protein BPLS_P4822 [Bathymodiolus platifrons methanotrophic gill symbiont]